MTKALSHDWDEYLRDLFVQGKSEITVCSPYISRTGIEFLLRNLSRDFKRHGIVNLICNLSPKNIYQGSTDPNAIMRLFEDGPAVKLFHSPTLHAKVYVQDSDQAIITSGNLTDGGVFKNLEYGVSITDPQQVRRIKMDLLDYASLGARVDFATLKLYCKLAIELNEKYRAREKSVRADFEKRFISAVKAANNSLVMSKLSGRSLNSILEKTILYLLEKQGAISTPRLHELVKEIHPDLCDDTVLRIINGVRHSAKWKHSVRSAQDSLKRRGLIKRSGKVWEITQRDPEVKYWLKPIGVVTDQISSERVFDETESQLHFSKSPISVKINDLMIVYAVGSKKLISLYKCDSVPMMASPRIIEREAWQARWPYYTINENLTPSFGRVWYGQNITYDSLEDLFLRQHPDKKITPSGSRITANLMRGRDKLRLTPEFGRFINEFISNINGKL